MGEMSVEKMLKVIITEINKGTEICEAKTERRNR